MPPEFASSTQAGQLGLARAFDWVRDAVVVADVESAGIVVWNPAAEAMFGYTAEQATALPLEDLIPDELRAAHRNGLRRFRESGHGSVIDRGRPVELVGIRSDGGRIPIELTLSTLPNAERRYVLALVRDISDRRRAEAERERLLATAEAALRTRDEFLSTLAHDLKLPLSNLMWHVELLRRRARDGRLEPAELDEELQTTAFDAADALGSIDELLDLTRIAAGAPVPLHLEVIDLVDLVTRAVRTRRQSTQHTLKLRCVEPNLMVHGDAVRLARVLNNLLDNAAKYSPDSRRIDVILERKVTDGVEWAVLRVRDHGLGIPAADLPHIFDRYRRGSNVANIRGEGLGLASVRQLVELHDGRVELESREGVGTTVAIRLREVVGQPLGQVPTEPVQRVTAATEA